MYFKVFLILLLSVNLYSSEIMLSDVYKKVSKVDFRYFDTKNTERHIKDFTKTFASYLEDLHKNLPMQTLKEKEWVKKELKRQSGVNTSIYDTYDFKLYRTYEDLEFYIKELKGISNDNDITVIMYRLTNLVNSMRDLYVFKNIQSFVKMKLMSSEALKSFGDSDSYDRSINLIIGIYFDDILSSYLSRVEYPQE